MHISGPVFLLLVLTLVFIFSDWSSDNWRVRFLGIAPLAVVIVFYLAKKLEWFESVDIDDLSIVIAAFVFGVSAGRWASGPRYISFIPSTCDTSRDQSI